MRTTLTILLVLLLFGCATTKKAETDTEKAETPLTSLEKSEKRTKLLGQLESIQKLMAQQKYEAAKLLLEPFLGIDLKAIDAEYLQPEIEQISDSLEKAIRLFTPMAENVTTEARLLNEVDRSLALPENYNKTVVIDAKTVASEILPTGEMEEKINQPISMHIKNAGVAELVGALKQVAGLNVIADDALQAEKSITVEVDNTPLKEILTYISRNMGVAFHLGANVVWITQADENDNGPSLTTRIIKLRSGLIPSASGAGAGFKGNREDEATEIVQGEGDNELINALNALLEDSQKGAVCKIYPHRNLLVIKDTIENIRAVENLIREFDKPPLQVAIEAKFITVSKDDLRDIGVDITQTKEGKAFQENNDPGIKIINSISALGGTAIQEVGRTAAGGALTLSGILQDRTYEILINALEKKNSTSSLSAPKITVLNNQKARFRKGSTVHYYEDYDVETANNGDAGETYVLVPDGSPTELELGMVFDVKVNIGNDHRTILLNLQPQIRTNLNWEYFSSGATTSAKLPTYDDQYIETTIAVASGQTVVLGGMIDREMQTTVRKVPILGDIPYLGWFFRHSIDTYVPKNLLIFVTATIIDPDGNYVELK